VIVIQSRLASTRLPAKALLPIGGRASVALCALRAANTGLPVVVATSDTAADDAIVGELLALNVHCFRGPHHDVLSRYAQATSALSPAAAVVRLTADNVFPDGAFVQSLLEEFERSGVQYLGTNSPLDGLPYGMSAEVFTAEALRKADREATSPADREHVTPWIRRNCSARRTTAGERQPHWSRLRCTVDSYEDYELVRRVFADCRDPVNAPWADLVAKLASLTPLGMQPRCPFRELPDGSVLSVLTLGSAQFGSKYGIANVVGVPDDSDLRTLLLTAVDAGVDSIDTASAYGTAEQRIGELAPQGILDRLRIVTKLDVLAGVPDDAPIGTVQDAVAASVYKSLHRLRRRRIGTLLLHRWAHHDAWNGAAWLRLLELKRAGLIDRLGVSVSNPSEALLALADPEVGHLQCPVNILDHRWREAGFAERIALRPNVIVHARSVFLQGLLRLPAQQWVRIPGVDAQGLCDRLDSLAREFGRLDRLDLCLAYVRALPWVSSLVVGMESTAQLCANLRYLQRPPLSSGELAAVGGAALPEALLNPALWEAAHG